MAIVIRGIRETDEHYQARKDAAEARVVARKKARQDAKDERREDREDRIRERQDAKTDRVTARQAGKSTRTDSRQAGKSDRTATRQAEQSARTATKADAGYYDEGVGETLSNVTHDVTAGGAAVAGAAADILGGGGLFGKAGDAAEGIVEKAGNVAKKAGEGLISDTVKKAAPWIAGGVLLLLGLYVYNRR